MPAGRASKASCGRIGTLSTHLGHGETRQPGDSPRRRAERLVAGRPRLLSAVAALELLAAAAPARVVAAEILLALARHALLGHHGAAACVERAGRHRGAVAAEREARATTRRGDRLRAGE